LERRPQQGPDQGEAEKRKRRAERKDRLLELRVEEAERRHAGTEGRQVQAEKPELDARQERWRIPLPAFWLILEQRLKRGKLATVNSLSEQTRHRDGIPFVGRTRVGKLVQWIEDHPEQAQRAGELHETPAGFRATADGVLVPRPREPGSRHASR
jgi:hypothetical protein